MLFFYSYTDSLVDHPLVKHSSHDILPCDYIPAHYSPQKITLPFLYLSDLPDEIISSVLSSSSKRVNVLTTVQPGESCFSKADRKLKWILKKKDILCNPLKKIERDIIQFLGDHHHDENSDWILIEGKPVLCWQIDNGFERLAVHLMAKYYMLKSSSRFQLP